MIFFIGGTEVCTLNFEKITREEVKKYLRQIEKKLKYNRDECMLKEVILILDDDDMVSVSYKLQCIKTKRINRLDG